MSKLTRKYSLRNTFAALALLAATAAQASVTVTNVTAAQRPGTNLVDIAYDVASTATNRVAVSLVVSNGAAAAPVVPEGMVLVQGGSLPVMNIGYGAPKVSSFYIGKYEVTWAEWQTVRTWAATNGYYDITNAGAGTNAKWGSPDNHPDNHPVTKVSWCDVVKWCNARSQKEGRTPVYMVGRAIYTNGTGGTKSAAVVVNTNATGYRLPTAAEWEFAARGGTQSRTNDYSGSTTNLDAVAWYLDNDSPDGTKAVGTKATNELGLYDMSGNVSEWCFDWLTKGKFRLLRGGCWSCTTDDCRVESRAGDDPMNWDWTYGFRSVLPPGQ